MSYLAVLPVPGLDPPKPDIDPGTVSKVARLLDFIGKALGVSLKLSSGDPPLGKEDKYEAVPAFHLPLLSSTNFCSCTNSVISLIN